MNYKYLIFILCCITNTIFCQRTLPNPIILVHGWTGSNTTWTEFTNYLEDNAGLTVSPNHLNFNLNSDNNNVYSELYNDVKDLTISNMGNYDVYVVNFNNGTLSNQAGAVKQGYALKLAIARVLRATGAKKVSLLGHSMGGLAIREYLQTKSNWQSDGQHHLAKMSTIGTPHGGSNLGSGDVNLAQFYDGTEASEAVRDLRRSYKSGYNGVYLYGGYESSSIITRGFGSTYYNLDVNCNGREYDAITGLNYKSIRTDLDFACIIGGPINSDLVVTVESQNLNNIYNINADLFYYNCSGDFNCHRNEPKKAITQMFQALDEPKKEPTELNFGTTYAGYFTTQADNSVIDLDEYTIFAANKGRITLNAKSAEGSNGLFILSDFSGKVYSTEAITGGISKIIDVPSIGYYKLSFLGNSQNSIRKYAYNLSFCSLPVDPVISNNGNLSFCEGQTVELSATFGYDTYDWKKDGVSIFSNTTKINPTLSGTYSVIASKCGLNFTSSNSFKVNVKPLPSKPEIIKEELPSQFVLRTNSTDSRQWQINGLDILGATEATFIPQELSTYTVTATKEGCSQISDPVIIKMDKPNLTFVGSNPFCDGDSLKLLAPLGFGGYIFSDGEKNISAVSNSLTVKKSGKYSLITQRGKFTSAPSDALEIVNIPRPIKPVIVLDKFGLKSTSEKNNQWYLEGVILKDSTGQFLKKITAGAYKVIVTENGCSSESDVFVITSSEKLLIEGNIQIFPNPSTGEFIIEFPTIEENFSIGIFNSQGNAINFRQSQLDLKKRIKIETHVPIGEYIVILKKGNSPLGFKIMIR